MDLKSHFMYPSKILLFLFCFIKYVQIVEIILKYDSYSSFKFSSRKNNVGIHFHNYSTIRFNVSTILRIAFSHIQNFEYM